MEVNPAVSELVPTNVSQAQLHNFTISTTYRRHLFHQDRFFYEKIWGRKVGWGDFEFYGDGWLEECLTDWEKWTFNTPDLAARHHSSHPLAF